MMDVEKLKQKILDLAIRGKLVPQDPNDEPASVLIEKIKAEKAKLVKEGKIKASKEESYIFKGSDNFYYENGVSKIEFNPNLDCSNFIVWIKGSDIIYPMQTTKPNGYSFDYIDIDAIDNKNQKISQPKTLLVKDAPSRASRRVFPNSTIFSLVRPYLRNIALVGKKYENCIASTGFYVLTPLPFIDEQYLFLLLTSDYIVNSLNYYMKGDNSPSITTTVIENFYFPIPPISYQKRIVRLFDLINPLIEQIKNSSGQIRTYCKAIKNKVLDLYFGENSSYKSYYGKRLTTTLKELIPLNLIGDGDWVLSENMDSNGEFRLIQLKHISNGNYLDKPYQCVNKDFFEKHSCSEIKENYLLINRLIADSMSVCIVPKLPFRTITAVDVCWIAPSPNIYNQEYLMYYLMSPGFQSQLLLKCGGTTRKRISKSNLINIPLHIHNIKYQEIIGKRIKDMFLILDNIAK